MYLFRSRTDSTRSLSFSLKIVFFSPPFFRGHIIDSPCKMSAGDYWIRFSHAVICTTFPLYTSGGVRSLATPNQPYLRGNRLLWGTAANRHIIPCVKPWWLQSAIMHQVNVCCRAGGNRKTGGSWLLLCHVLLVVSWRWIVSATTTLEKERKTTKMSEMASGNGCGTGHAPRSGCRLITPRSPRAPTAQPILTNGPICCWCCCCCWFCVSSSWTASRVSLSLSMAFLLLFVDGCNGLVVLLFSVIDRPMMMIHRSFAVIWKSAEK